MKTLEFSDGDKMPIIGLGTWKSAPGDVYLAVKQALRSGYRHIDCAPVYGNEAEVGRALTESFEEGVASRGDIWVTSKLWNHSHAPEDVSSALEATLEDLKLEYLDLFLIHWPVAHGRGVQFPRSGTDLVSLDDLPIAETWAAMERLVDRKRCRHIGVSNFSIVKLKSLIDGSRIKPEMNQVELHPYLQQNGMLDFCRNNGVHLTAYSPLGSPDRPAGLKEAGEPVLLQDPTISAIAQRHGITPAQVLISWAIQRGTAVIPKSVHPERLRENLAAATTALDLSEMNEIGRLDRNRRYVSGSFWTMPGSPYTLANLWDGDGGTC